MHWTVAIYIEQSGVVFARIACSVPASLNEDWPARASRMFRFPDAPSKVVQTSVGRSNILSGVCKRGAMGQRCDAKGGDASCRFLKWFGVQTQV